MASTTLVVPALLHRPSTAGATYWGPGDKYRFLVTGEETGGAYFAMEALVPPGGGPPPHVHRNEDETFYVLEGRVEFRLGDERVTGRPRRLRQRPARPRAQLPQLERRGRAADPHVHPRRHRALLRGDARARAGPGQPQPDNVGRGRCPATPRPAPRHGMEFLV